MDWNEFWDQRLNLPVGWYGNAVETHTATAIVQEGLHFTSLSIRAFRNIPSVVWYQIGRFADGKLRISRAELLYSTLAVDWCCYSFTGYKANLS
jgi:hypothetical protein